MKFHIITLFPDAFRSYLGESILKRAIEDKKIAVKFYNPRDFACPNRAKRGFRIGTCRIDRPPYGGGPGMVIQAEPVIRAIEKVYPPIRSNGRIKTKVIWLTPSGKQFDTKLAKSYARKYTDIIFVCGRYEGIDARVKKIFKAEEVSVGPFVLTGGELPAMIMIDSISRQIEGVLGDINSLEENRVASPDVYTRPESFRYKGKIYRVPKILLSGHHARINEWRSKRKM
jgi:tRNA (guanine37-N1)-methyltransferase